MTNATIILIILCSLVLISVGCIVYLQIRYNREKTKQIKAIDEHLGNSISNLISNVNQSINALNESFKTEVIKTNEILKTISESMDSAFTKLQISLEEHIQTNCQKVSQDILHRINETIEFRNNDLNVKMKTLEHQIETGNKHINEEMSSNYKETKLSLKSLREKNDETIKNIDEIIKQINTPLNM